ncbi:UDP-N-acetylglucosamine 3-dehydrogenase [Desulfolithobacter dissulfuricans]|uniref:UDP-N-acetylglucosamine 3-dehydrogenase n=1 Tax=Desulfolithobacter dissulfuricans TaxID=2795293 RepID=A0A915U8V0_9BACT|nr:Gfo/Idh/MocA family oxidoreductase [Desulfolithobacter dissulfuricans]BCO08361.1 UDP-N-acetylglucosamine 3-dehydrogenase [Desulfolithobacter dissulfuricans]
MEKIRVGVIGVGYLGRFHAQKYAAMEDVDLVGVVDVNPDQAQKVARECGTQAFTDYLDLLGRIDAVSIVVPTVHHHAVAMACLEHNLDVLVEKPITTTVEEADELIDLAEKKDRVLQVGHLERFNPAVMAMQPLLHNPLFIEAHRISVFKNRGTDVDVILDLMIHDIDIILSIIKAPIKTIHTVGAPVITPLTDIANARIIFENGCTANVTVSRISMDNIRRMRIFQPGTYLSVDFSEKEVMAIRLKKGVRNGLPLPDISKYGFKDRDILEMELRDFIHNVRDRSRPRVSGHEGRRALAVALQVVAQVNENRARVEEMLGGETDFSGLES